MMKKYMDSVGGGLLPDDWAEIRKRVRSVKVGSGNGKKRQLEDDKDQPVVFTSSQGVMEYPLQ